MARSTTDIYGDVQKPDDVHAINRSIRAEMRSARSRPALTELKKRSDYLCALAVSPSWRKRFGAGSARLLRVAMDEERSTTAFANRIARSHGWEPNYDAWGGDRNRGAVKRRTPRGAHKPSYRPTQSRYTGGGKVTYLVYHSPGATRGRATRPRTHVRQLYLPATARDVKLDTPKMLRRRTGRTAYGVTLHYRSRLPRTSVHRGHTRYQLPERSSERRRIVDLPRNATGVRLTRKPPKASTMDVR